MKLGQRIRYIKTHEGHLGRVTSMVHKHGDLAKEVVKYGIKCDCGAELSLNPRDLQTIPDRSC